MPSTAVRSLIIPHSFRTDDVTVKQAVDYILAQPDGT